MSVVKEASGVVGVIVLAALGIFGLAYGSYELYAFFAPKYTAVDNKVFHESQQYNDGMIRDLENIKREYQQATPEGKQALKATVIHRFEIYPRSKLVDYPDLLNFYDSLNQ